jgi:hypothetical protein
MMLAGTQAFSSILKVETYKAPADVRLLNLDKFSGVSTEVLRLQKALLLIHLKKCSVLSYGR